MNLHSGPNKVVSLQQALDASRTLAKHNPFVRMTEEEQKLANQASTILKKSACTEELTDLMRGMPEWQTDWNNEKWKALF